MNFTMWDDIETKLRNGFTYEQIKQYTRVEEKYIKMIDNYVKESENANKDIKKSN